VIRFLLLILVALPLAGFTYGYKNNPQTGKPDMVVMGATTADVGLVYASGAFTPVLQFGGASVGLAYSRQIGTYTRIGDRLLYNITITLSSKGTSTGSVSISGLPLASNAMSNNFATASIYLASTNTLLVQYIDCYIVNSSTVINIAKLSAGTSTLLADTDLTSTSTIVINGQYQI
jgi:hypothetical protein